MSGVKIVSSGSTLYYVNCEYFKEQVFKLTGINPVTVMAARDEMEKKKKEMKKERRKGKVGVCGC